MRGTRRFIGLLVLVLSLSLGLLTPARALTLFSNATIADTFNARTVSWRADTAANRSAAADVMRKVDRAIARYESQPTRGGWPALLDGLRDRSALAKLDAVNRWVNNISYVSD